MLMLACHAPDIADAFRYVFAMMLRRCCHTLLRHAAAFF